MKAIVTKDVAKNSNQEGTGKRMVSSRYTIKIVNVVATTSVGQEINLKAVTLALEGADYDPQVFAGVVYHTKNPKAAALLFRSGKIVCTGTKSIDEAHKAVENVFDSLRNVGIDVKGTPEITVQNIVASADLQSVLNVNAIALRLGLENIRVRARTVSRPRVPYVRSESGDSLV